MKRILAMTLAVAPIVASVPLLAQIANHDPKAVEAGNYAVDSAHTLVLFTLDHFGISEYFGTLPGATGTLSLDPKNVGAARLDVSVPVATVSTTNKKLDGELVGPDWLDASKYPTMRFVSTKVVKTGASTADVTGNLTLHGVTRPVTLKARFKAGAQNPMKKVYTLGFNAEGIIKRTEFGVSRFAPMIGDDTRISITAAFEKQ